MTETLRLILVEDSPDDAELLVRELMRGGFAVDMTRVETEPELRARLSDGDWDIFITDYKLPTFDAPGALRVRRELRPDLPAIVVSGQIGEDVAVETLKAGAGDYLLKDNLTRLVPAVRREIAEAAERGRLVVAEADVRRSERELAFRGQIAEAFVTTTGDIGFERALDVVLEALQSPVGLFAYIDADGAAVVPTFRGDVWDGCRVDGKANRFPAGTWKDAVWAQALRTRATVVLNAPGRVPAGHIVIERVIATPLLHAGKAIGHFEIANKPTDYDQGDVERLEHIAAYLAPILHSRLERRREELAKDEALRERETIAQHFEYLTRQANDMIMLLSDDARVLEANDRALETYGYRLEEMCRLTIADLRAPETLPTFEHDIAAARREHGTIFETVHRRRDGSTFPVEVSSRRIELDGTHYYQSIIRDISERKAAAEAIRLSEQRYRALFEQSPVGVFVADTDLLVVDCNERMAGMLRRSREALVGYDLSSMPDREAVKAFVRALAGVPSHYEGRALGTGKRADLFLSLRCAPMHDAEGGVSGIVGVVADMTERRKFISTINKLANQDAVTGLPNRTLFRDRLTQAITYAEREGQKLALAVVDLDRFKQVNDMLGRPGGDKLLKLVGKRLLATARDGDTVACFGSDEFHLILPGIGGVGDTLIVAEKILKSFAKPWKVNKEEVFSGASIGIAIYPDDADELDELVKCADGALRMAKRDGGSVWRLFDQSMGVLAAERQRMENAMHHAIDSHQFVGYFQPIVAAADGRIKAVETLMRWQDPERGLVSPLEFIPLAEDTGMIVPMGEQILHIACRQLVAWQRAGYDPVRGAVNLSSRQFRQRDLVAMVESALAESGLEAKYLELEVTESTAMDDPDYSIGVLRELRTLGVSIALDDFGTGYSSLALLGKLPLDVFKIDRAFVGGVTTSKSDAAIVSAVIALGHELGLVVVAEGVETAAQWHFLRKQGCDEIQGFYFSRPLPGDECTPLIAAGTTTV